MPTQIDSSRLTAKWRAEFFSSPPSRWKHNRLSRDFFSPDDWIANIQSISMALHSVIERNVAFSVPRLVLLVTSSTWSVCSPITCLYDNHFTATQRIKCTQLNSPVAGVESPRMPVKISRSSNGCLSNRQEKYFREREKCCKVWQVAACWSIECFSPHAQRRGRGGEREKKTSMWHTHTQRRS